MFKSINLHKLENGYKNWIVSMNSFIDKDIPGDCKLLPMPANPVSIASATEQNHEHAWDSLTSITLNSIIASVIVRLK